MKPRPTKQPQPNLYLVGFMGTGKSTVGWKVAQLLDMDFVDSDHSIEDHFGIKIPEIFERYGESKFRELESHFVRVLQPKQNAVVSCGGGLVTQQVLLERIRKMGIVIVLYASVETLVSRLSKDQSRPLMQTENPRERIESLLADRREAYQKAGVGIMTDGYTSQEVADHVIRIYLEKIQKS